MKQRYRVTGARPVLDNKPGTEFDAELEEAEESEYLANGWVEFLPRAYKVIGSSRVMDTEQGGVFEAALRLGQERMLVEGGHIERTTAKPKPAPDNSNEGK